MKQHTKGVISVFLLIIFTAMYLITGIMVDYGRIKMAQATVGLSADQAAESVLSYYNKMLYEMYGLLATDSDSTEKAKEIFESYLSKTLMTANAYSEENISKISNSVFGSIKDTSYFDGYKFNIDKVNVGSRFNLSNTDVTKTQILETMKYRAPYEWVNAEDSFINKISSFLKLKDIIDANLSFRKDFSNEDIIFEQQKIIKKYNSITTDIYSYAKEDKSKEIKDIINNCNDSLIFSYDEENGETEQDMKDKNLRKVRNMIETLEEKTFNYENLKTRTEQLITSMDSNVKESNTYIKKIEEQLKNEETSERKLVFQNNLLLAKNSCGEIIKYMYILKWINEELAKQEESVGDVSNTAKQKVKSDSKFADAVFNSTGYKNLEESIKAVIENKDAFNSELPTDYDKVNIDNKEILEDAKNKKQDNKLVNDYDKTIEGAVSDLVDTGNDDNNSESECDTDSLKFDGSNIDAFNILDIGQPIFENIKKGITDKSDGLYIDEYIMENFANVVHQQNMLNIDDPFLISDDKDSITAVSLPDTIHSVSEIEYIITGNNESNEAIAEIYGEILGIRVVLNTAAIFTDSVKVSQAVSISGPWYPALLVGWAVAESTIDLINIQNGYKVHLFKQGSDWSFSLEGAAKKLVEYGIDKAADKAIGGVETITSKVSGYINEGIYNAHNEGSTNLSEIASEVDNLNNELTNIENEIVILNNEDSEVHYQVSELKGMLTDVSNNLNQNNPDAINEVVLKVAKIENETNEKAEKIINSAGGKLNESLKSSIDEVIPKSMSNLEQVSSSLDIKLGYGDYLRLFLLLKNEDTKLENMQKIIQVNMQKDDPSFTMAKAATNFYAEVKVSLRYMFMTKAFVNQQGVNGNRHQLRILTNKAY